MSEEGPGRPGTEGLASLQGEVHRRFGRCVLKLQQYEWIMKDFLARQRLESPAHSIADTHARRAEDLSRKTLGHLVASFGSDIWPGAAADADSPSPYDVDAPTMLEMRFNLSMEEDDRQALTASLQQLVTLRNNLVHRFLLDQDIWTKEGCIAAAAYLDEAHEEITHRLQELRSFHSDLRTGYETLAALLADPQFSEQFFHGILPGDAGVDWPVATIVRLLRSAEIELARGGWTRLDEAVGLITARAPDHSPSRYGCSTWRQVLHESHPLFIVRRDAGGPAKQGRTWYRSNGELSAE